MTEVITDKKEIQGIISEKIKDKVLIFSKYYQWGIAQRGINHEKVLEIFPQFDKITEIEIDKLKYGDLGYELFYVKILDRKLVVS